MEHISEAFVGLDTSKLRNAVAIAARLRVALSPTMRPPKYANDYDKLTGVSQSSLPASMSQLGQQ